MHFNLAENRKDDEAPFAFLATYTTRLSAHGKAAAPAARPGAARVRRRARTSDRLLSLLLPVQRAAERCAWLQAMVDAGEIFHPLRWTPREAFRLLRDVPAARGGRRRRAHAGALAGRPAAAAAGDRHRRRRSRRPGSGTDALLDFRMEVTLDGEPLTPARDRGAARAAPTASRSSAATGSRSTASGCGGMLDAASRRVERAAAGDGLTFAEAMRLLAGRRRRADDDAGRRRSATGRASSPGPGSPRRSQGLRAPEGLARVDPGAALHGTLRPYQQVGVRWLHLLSRSASAPASPTTWASARRSRCSRCCSC